MRKPSTIRSSANKILLGETGPLDILDECLSTASRLNPVLDVFITPLFEYARAQSRELEKEAKGGRIRGPLHGIPVAIKDIFYIKGVRCTAGSKIMENFVAPRDAVSVAKLKKAGAVIVGTTNLHEFASGVTTVNPHFGATRNPWDRDRIVGGSSGGSAAAVASGMALGSLGTDTAGSVRIPASLCGVCGLKPTYERVSREGVFPLSPSLDHVGPTGNCSWDLAALLEGMSERTSGDGPEGFNDEGEATILNGGVRLAYVPEKFIEGRSGSDVSRAFKSFVRNLQKLGIDVLDLGSGLLGSARGAFGPIRFAEALEIHEKWVAERPQDYGGDVLTLLKKGEAYTAVEYIRVKDRARSISSRLSALLKPGRVLVLPTVPVTAPKVGQADVKVMGESVPVYSLLSRFTLPFNISGTPALSLPAFTSRAGLPIGIQISGGMWQEPQVLGLGDAYERRFGLNVAL